jgi:predicted metal-dependent peptidase
MSTRITPFDELPPSSRQTWAAARVWAARQSPYLATALLALAPVVIDQSSDPVEARFDLSAFPSDERWHVYLDPDVLAEVDVATLGFWLIHQVTHLLRDHAARFGPLVGSAEPVPPMGRRTEAQITWNLAADAEIDDDLREGALEPFRLDRRAATPVMLGLPDALLAEQYWDALAKRDDGREDAVDCGSGCDAQGRPWDQGQSGISEVERRLLARDVARRIREHTCGRGDVPAGWQRWADDLLEPVVDWRRTLTAAVRRGIADTAGRVDFTYRRPSRRASVAPAVVLPSLRQPLPTVAVVIDTSGSMSDQMLAQALGEVSGVLRSLGIGRRNLSVVCCDAAAYEAQRVLDARDLRLLGGGGTDMCAGIAAACELRPRPDLVVVLTDGRTPWPSTEPRGTRVVVGLMDPRGSVPSWATKIVIQPAIAAAGWST